MNNPLLNRLFQNKSKEKTKRASFARQEPQSLDRVLVPKIHRAKLQSLPDVNFQRRKTTIVKNNIGKLPSIVLRPQQPHKTKVNFRNRKLSTTLKDMQSHLFPTELDISPLQDDYTPVSAFMETKTRIVTQENEFQNEDEVFQYLKVLEQNQQLNEQFCYMNRRKLPYSFYIVDYEQRNPDEYLTVSLRGITYVQGGQNQFYTIQKLSKEIQRYRKIKMIHFFQQYLIVKVLKHWKQKMVTKKFNTQCKYVINHLFNQNPIMQEFFHFLHNLVCDYDGGNFLGLRVIKTFELNQFIEESNKNSHELLKSVNRFDTLIEKNLKIALEKCIKKFRIDERVTLGSAEKQRSDSFLPYDNKKKSMKYTQMAKLKQFEAKIYRLIKYTDLVRFNAKLQMIKKWYENAIVQLQKLIFRYKNKQSVSFVSWISVVGSISSAGLSHLTCKPSYQEIELALAQIKNNTLDLLFKSHRLLIDNKDNLYCQNYQYESEERCSKYDLKYYVFNSTEYQLLAKQYNDFIEQIKQATTKTIHSINQSLIRIYDESQLTETIDYYLNNENIKNYLENHQISRSIIENCQQIYDFALLVINIKETKQQVKLRFQQKYKNLSVAIPNELQRRCEVVSADIGEIYLTFKDNPYTVKNFIDFSKAFIQKNKKLKEVQQAIQKLLELELMIYQKGIRIAETTKILISQIQGRFKWLVKRAQTIQENQEKDRKKFQLMIDEMIPNLDNKAEVLLTEIYNHKSINDPSSQLIKSQQALKEINTQFRNIQTLKQQIFYYQIEMKLGHRQVENYFKLQSTVNYLNKLWNGRKNYLQIEEVVKNTGYGLLNQLNKQPLLTFVIDCEHSISELECFDLIQQFKSQTQRLLKIIKISQLLSSETLQPEHLNNLKSLIKSQNKHLKQHLLTKEGAKTITSFQIVTETNALQIELQIQQIVFLSAQESIIKKQLTQIEEFWKKAKIKFLSEDINGNGILVTHLDANEQLHEKLGYFIITLKNIQSSSHAINQYKTRAEANSKICSYLRQMLWKWSEVQKSWLKLLPLMTNCPAVKHQSNVYFQFTSVDNNLKKLIKTINDLSSIRKVTEDANQQKFLAIIKKSQEELRMINKIFQQFLQNKRSTYNRFYFLTDVELISILENVKDAKSSSNYAKYCFNCEKLLLQNELISGFQNQSQVFKLRKNILRGEPDQIFKGISENMKVSMKFMARAMLPKIKITTNIELQLKQYPIQVALVVDRLLWTQMSQYYLNTSSYDEYQLLIRKPYQQMASLITKIPPQSWGKLAMRLTQAMALKETGESLIRDQVSQRDFKWKQQFKFYFDEDEIAVEQFDKKIHYGCEYYPPTKIHIQTQNSTRLLYECFYSCVNDKTLLFNGREGEGKRNLIYQSGIFYGCYQKEVVCNVKLSCQYLLRFVQGALLAGAWLVFYQFNHLSYQVMAELMHLVANAKNNQKCHPRTLFSLVHHGNQCERISIYAFNNFTIYEPQRRKICEGLLQIYRFKDYEQLTHKIISFLQVAKPFFERVLGSDLSLMRRIVDAAGKVKINGHIGENEHLIIAEAIRLQIINKERENIYQVLGKALASYFDISILERHETKYFQKVQVLTTLVSSPECNNIIVLGQRSCKTKLISQVLNINLKLKNVTIYGQTTDNLFNSNMMEYLYSISADVVLIYDANQIISEWNDLITSGYLFIDGRKIVLKNKIIMELRKINKCTPSFIGKCQIVYIGQHMLSKRQKFMQKLNPENSNNHTLTDILTQLFGEQFERISEYYLDLFLTYFNFHKLSISPKIIHRNIIWLLTVLQDDQLWSKYYSGKYYEFCLIGNYVQLSSIDTARYQPFASSSGYLYVPTKQSILISETINTFINYNLTIMLYGPSQSGKTSLLRFIDEKELLNSKNTTQEWSQYLKKIYTIVRREGKNILVDMQTNGHKIFIDDLDLGSLHHYQYLRSLAETSSFRDRLFSQYHIQNYKLLCVARNKPEQNKFADRVFKIPLKELNKESIDSIFRVNLEKFIKNNSMNKQVQDFIEKMVFKSIFIIHDDLSNIFTINTASSLLLGVLRNLLSLPKKNSFISAELYQQFFKSHLRARIEEKAFTKKLKYMIRAAQQNLFKIIFNDSISNALPADIFMFSERQYRTIKLSQLRATISKNFPNLIVFDKLLENVIYILNQYECIDKDIIMLGRKGTGKKYILLICSKLGSINIVDNLSDAIIAAIKKQNTILVNTMEYGTQCFYQEIMNCQSDKDLQKFVSFEKREIYYEHVPKDGQSSCNLLLRLKNHIRHTFLIEQKSIYRQFCTRTRQAINFPVCLVEEWPAEAIVNIFTVSDTYSQMHAQIFTNVNKVILENNYTSFSMKHYQKYLKLYSELFEVRQNDAKKKMELLTNIHFKFSESCSMIRSWQARVDILRQEIKQTINKANEVILGNKLYSFCLSILSKQTKETQEATGSKKQTLFAMKTDLEQKLSLLKRVLAKIQKIVGSFQRTQLSQLKKIYKSNKYVYFGLECICILFKQETTDQKAINRILADPNLLMRMKHPDLLSFRNQLLQLKFKKQYYILEKELKSSTNQLSKTLIEWLKSIIEYWQNNEEYKVEKQKYTILQTQYSNAKIKHQNLLKQIQNINQEIFRLNKIVYDNQKLKKQKEQEFDSISKKIDNAKAITPILKKQQSQTKELIKHLQHYIDNLRGNCILTAYCASFLPLKKIKIKEKLLKELKRQLKNNLISYSDKFMAEISGKQINSIQSMNMTLLYCSPPKLIVDPQRKFLTYLQDNNLRDFAETIIQDVDLKIQMEDGKIYHTIDQSLSVSQNIIVIDWKAIALDEKQVIFLKLAENRKPEYFKAKDDLEKQINQNLKKVENLKDILYNKICSNAIKIIQDEQFIEIGQELVKLQDQTQVLKRKKQQKILQINRLSKQINDEVNKIFLIIDRLKEMRQVSLQIIGDIAIQDGQTLNNLIRWAISNIEPKNRNAYIISLIVAFRKQMLTDLLKEMLTGQQLRAYESSKIKKPPHIGIKNWDIVCRLSGYSSNLRKFLQNIQKFQKEFEQWCIDGHQSLLPEIFACDLDFIEHMALLFYLKPKAAPRLIPKLFSIYFTYELHPFSNKQLIQKTHPKYPFIIHSDLNNVIDACSKINEGRFKLQRVCKIKNELQMKSIIWKSMQNKEWLIIHDILNKKHLQMVENIIYYVMNYDMQPGFRVFIYADQYLTDQKSTKEQIILKQSSFLAIYAIQLHKQQISYDQILKSSNLQLNCRPSSSSQVFTESHIFNRVLKQSLICYVALVHKYPSLRYKLPKRILQTLSYIMNHKIPLQFNVFTYVQYISKVFSYNTLGKAKEVEQLWQNIVDENKLGDKNFYGIPLNKEQSLDRYIKGNAHLIGCQQSFFFRQEMKKFKHHMNIVFQIQKDVESTDDLLGFLRIQLTKTPSLIIHKQASNKNFIAIFNRQIQKHNLKINQVKYFLQWLNLSSTKEQFLEDSNEAQSFNWPNVLRKLSQIFESQITENNIKSQVLAFLSFLKRQHDFLLYFNPSLACYTLDPSVITNLQGFISSYIITYLQQQKIKDGHYYSLFLQFARSNSQKQFHANQGLLLINLRYREFKFNYQMKTVDPLFEIDGEDTSPIVILKLKKLKALNEDDEDKLIVNFCKKDEIVLQSYLLNNSVYSEWVLREAQLIID